MSLAELLQKYPDDDAAEEFFVEQRWPDGVACPHCGNCDVQDGANHPDMSFRCRWLGLFLGQNGYGDGKLEAWMPEMADGSVPAGCEPEGN